MPRITGPTKVRGDTSRGVHVRALYIALSELLLLAPREARARIQGHIDALVAAYPYELIATPQDIDQQLAEEDGIPHED